MPPCPRGALIDAHVQVVRKWLTSVFEHDREEEIDEEVNLTTDDKEDDVGDQEN